MIFKQIFIEFINSLLKRFFYFTGRSIRRELLYVYIWHVLILLSCYCTLYSVSNFNNYHLLIGGGLIFLTTTQLLAVICRRLHDLNLNSSWVFFGMFTVFIITSVSLPSVRAMPFIQFLILYTTAFPLLLIFPGGILIGILLLKKGTPGPNRFGDEPEYYQSSITTQIK